MADRSGAFFVVTETKPETDSQTDPDVLAQAAAVASEEESGAAVTETESLGTGEVEKQPAVALSLDELEAKLGAEPLSPEEGKQLKTLRQERETLTARQYQSQRDQEMAAREMAQAEAQRVAELRTKGTAFLTRIRDIEDAEIARAEEQGVRPDWEHIRERRVTAFSDLMAETEAIHLAPVEHSLREAILQMGYYGDTPQNRRALAGKDLAGLYTELTTSAYEIGKRAGPGKGQVVLSQAELDKRDKATAEKAVDDYLAKHPEAGASTRTRAGEGGGSGGWRTKEEARNLHAQGKLSTPEMKRINADASIPEGGYGR